jgi:aldose 1-epimerase
MEQVKNDITFLGQIDGQEVVSYTLTNNNITVSITNFGATITNIITPDKNGHLADIALGYDDLQGYINDDYYMGGIVGRFANRVAGGLVELDGKKHQLTLKEGGFHHHGGAIGFNKKVWRSEYINNDGLPAVKLEYLSPDGEEGFPGNLTTTVIYTLNKQNQLVVDITATTDQTTLLNLTQHTYFNLAGHNSGTILDHELLLPLDEFLPVNTMQVPNGELQEVSNTPFDFRESKKIVKHIIEPNEQLLLSRGYDHSWVIKHENSPEIKLAACATDENSGRTLAVYTTEPAVHLYTGNFLENVSGKSGATYGHRSGFCLETQQYPDAPNKPHFPSTVLRPGSVFNSRTIFEFGTHK